jgi:DNA-3-methyladenine glycosylase I
MSALRREVVSVMSQNQRRAAYDTRTGFDPYERIMPTKVVSKKTTPNKVATKKVASKKTGSEKVSRCSWADGDDAVMREYHDTEWGVPLRDDTRLFEFLVLEGAQAGLSWSTVLNKRDAYRRAFHGFDIERVARMTDAALEKLLLNPALIRNRLKIYSARRNAQAALRVINEFGSLEAYFWSFVGGKPIRNRWGGRGHVPARTELSDLISNDMKKRDFNFVGSTIVYAHMQATGMVNDHFVSCFRHGQV